MLNFLILHHFISLLHFESFKPVFLHEFSEVLLDGFGHQALAVAQWVLLRAKAIVGGHWLRRFGGCRSFVLDWGEILWEEGAEKEEGQNHLKEERNFGRELKQPRGKQVIHPWSDLWLLGVRQDPPSQGPVCRGCARFLLLWLIQNLLRVAATSRKSLVFYRRDPRMACCGFNSQT